MLWINPYVKQNESFSIRRCGAQTPVTQKWSTYFCLSVPKTQTLQMQTCCDRFSWNSVRTPNHKRYSITGTFYVTNNWKMANMPACVVGTTFLTIHCNSPKFYIVINSWIKPAFVSFKQNITQHGYKLWVFFYEPVVWNAIQGVSGK